MEHDYSQMEMLQCPHCKFKNVWGQSIDHHIFYNKDKLHEESRSILQAIDWSLKTKYNNPNMSKLTEIMTES